MIEKAVNCIHQLTKGVLRIMMVNEICEKKYNKPLSGCTNEEIYYALLDMTKDLAAKKESEAGKKKVYYISAEFLIGKLLSNNLINLGLYKTVKEELEAAGKDIGGKKIRIVHPSRQHTQRMKIKPTQRMKKLPFLLSKTTMNYVISYGISCQRLTLFSKQQMEKKD